jgi:hypothetical protein
MSDDVLSAMPDLEAKVRRKSRSVKSLLTL